MFTQSMIKGLKFFCHKDWRFADRIQFLNLLTIGNDLKQLLLFDLSRLMTSFPSSLGQPLNLSQLFHLLFNMSLALVLLNAFKSIAINSCYPSHSQMGYAFARDTLVWPALCRRLLTSTTCRVNIP